jgi:hypothetical protein
MKNMGQVQIFKIELTDRASDARLTLAAGRELGGDHFISFDEFVLPLFSEQASAFAMAVLRLVYRRRQSTPKPGALWRRTVGDSVSPAFRVELGLTDEAHVYVEAAGTKIICDDGQGDVLQAVLERFREDILAVNTMPEGSDDSMRWGIAAGLRDPDLALPRWADDTKW